MHPLVIGLSPYYLFFLWLLSLIEKYLLRSCLMRFPSSYFMLHLYCNFKSLCKACINFSLVTHPLLMELNPYSLICLQLWSLIEVFISFLSHQIAFILLHASFILMLLLLKEGLNQLFTCYTLIVHRTKCILFILLKVVEFARLWDYLVHWCIVITSY